MAARQYEYERPWLYPKQQAAIFCAERYGLVEASTKSGKTVSCMIWLFEQAIKATRPNQNYWWVAPIYGQAAIAYGRLKHSLPGTLKIRWNDTKLTATLPNKAVMWFKGADNADSLYGEDVYAAVIDEASRVKEPAWYAVRSTLTATRGPVRIIGNVKGRKNWFFKMCRRAQGGDQDMHYAKITAADAVAAGVLAAEEVEDAKRNLPDAVARELYDAEPSDDEGNPFGIEAIRACILPAVPGKPNTVSTEPGVWWGCDLAKAKDWTVLIGLDQSGHIASFDRWHSPWTETKQRIRSRTKYALIDSTGVGDPVVEDLQRGDGGGSYEGFTFSSKSKQQLMEGLAVAIQQRRIRIAEGVVVDELEAFEYVYSASGVKYSAPEGMHDDCVMALALAVQRMGVAPEPAFGYTEHQNPMGQRQRQEPIQPRQRARLDVANPIRVKPDFQRRQESTERRDARVLDAAVRLFNDRHAAVDCRTLAEDTGQTYRTCEDLLVKAGWIETSAGQFWPGSGSRNEGG